MLIKENLKELKTLSVSEQNVANNILSLGVEIKDMSIRELAKIAYSSTSAVTRLCNKLGFKGYKDFKEAFLDEEKYLNGYFSKVDANVPFNKDDNLARVCNSVVHLYEETSNDTLSLIDYQMLIYATTLLFKAKNIHVICIGVGLEFAKVFADRMMRIGKKVIISDNPNFQYYYAYHACKDDCFIIVSYTGTTQRTKLYFEKIVSSPASSILITSVGENSLSKRADVTLRMTTREKLYSNIGSFSSSVSIMLIFDLLYSAVFHKDYEQNFNLKKQISKDYEPYRVSSNEVMNEE